jgi:hypothetical protein
VLNRLRVLFASLSLVAVSASGAEEPPIAQDAATAATASGKPSVQLGILSGWSSPVDPESATSVMDDLDPLTRDKADSGKRGEWVVAPIPFKSPLLGAGLKLGVMRINESKSEGDDAPRDSMFGLGGMYAEGGSWAAAAGDRRYWASGKVRTTLAAGTGELNYDLTLSSEFGEARLPVTQEAGGVSLTVEYNVFKNGWLGGGLRHARTPISIQNVPQQVEGLFPDNTYDLNAVNFSGEWDTRDDQFYPLSGSLITADVDYNLIRSFNSEDDFVRYRFAYNGYRALAERFVLAWRAYLEAVSGGAPFFALSWFGVGADLRGYTPGRYVGNQLAAVQAEGRWQATRRLGFVAFGGIGGVYGDVPGFEQSNALPAGGVGLRWRLTDDNRINFRIDYGWGRDDDTLTISVGEAF